MICKINGCEAKPHSYAAIILEDAVGVAMRSHGFVSRES